MDESVHYANIPRELITLIIGIYLENFTWMNMVFGDNPPLIDDVEMIPNLRVIDKLFHLKVGQWFLCEWTTCWPRTTIFNQLLSRPQTWTMSIYDNINVTLTLHPSRYISHGIGWGIRILCIQFKDFVFDLYDIGGSIESNNGRKFISKDIIKEFHIPHKVRLR